MKNLCDCCGVREADREVVDDDNRTVPIWRTIAPARHSSKCWLEHFDACGNDWATASKSFVERIRSRRAKPAEAPRFYGTQPSPLPETLPAGTKSLGTSPCGVVTAAHGLVLIKGSLGSLSYGPGESWGGEKARRGVAASYIDWSTVAGQETGEAWCARQLAEYTGLPAHCVERHRYGIVVRPNGNVSGLQFQAPHDRVGARDAAWFREELAKCSQWPRQAETAVAGVSGGTHIPVASPNPVSCRFCSGAARPEHDTCVYCGPRIRETGTHWHNEPNNVAAWKRLAAFDRRQQLAERPTSRARGSQALGHPAAWPSVEGDEP